MIAIPPPQKSTQHYFCFYDLVEYQWALAFYNLLSSFITEMLRAIFFFPSGVFPDLSVFIVEFFIVIALICSHFKSQQSSCSFCKSKAQGKQLNSFAFLYFSLFKPSFWWNAFHCVMAPSAGLCRSMHFSSPSSKIYTKVPCTKSSLWSNHTRNYLLSLVAAPQGLRQRCLSQCLLPFNWRYQGLYIGCSVNNVWGPPPNHSSFLLIIVRNHCSL